MAQLQPHTAGAASVTIGIDPHKGSHTAAAVDARQQVVAQVRVPATRAGYRQLRRWAAGWPDRRWAIENAPGLGRALAQWLLADGECVVDVPPKLSARVRLPSNGHGRKTGPADAASAALAACGPTELQAAALEGHAATLRPLSDRRDDLVARRTQVLNRLHALLAALAPGTVSRRLSADRAAALLRGIRASAGPRRTRRPLAGDLVREVRRLDGDIAAGEARIAEAVEVSRTTLVELFGIGPIPAAKILGRMGDVRRFSSTARFASYCGVAPIEASSGDVVRVPRKGGGDRPTRPRAPPAAGSALGRAATRTPASQQRAFRPGARTTPPTHHPTMELQPWWGCDRPTREAGMWDTGRALGLAAGLAVAGPAVAYSGMHGWWGADAAALLALFALGVVASYG